MLNIFSIGRAKIRPFCYRFRYWYQFFENIISNQNRTIGRRERDFLAINASIVTQRRRIFPSSARNLFPMITQISLKQFRIALDYLESTVLQNCNSFEKWILWSSQSLKDFSNNYSGILLRITTIIYKTDSKVSTRLDCNVIFPAKPFKNTQTSYLHDD